MSVGYRVVFASANIEKEITKFVQRLPYHERQRLYDAMAGLGEQPRAQQSKSLRAAVEVHGYTAHYRLRVGDYRVLYDVDNPAKKVILLAIRRRSEKTYQ